MAMATRVPHGVEQLLKLEEDGKMVIIRANLGKEMVRTIEQMLSSSPGNGFETMVGTTPNQTENMVQNSPTRTGHSSTQTKHWLKPRAKSVFPPRRKSVKRMMFEPTARYIASLWSRYFH